MSPKPVEKWAPLHATEGWSGAGHVEIRDESDVLVADLSYDSELPPERAEIVVAEIVRRWNAHEDLLAALEALNHVGGHGNSPFCVCPRGDGEAPDSEHSTACKDARGAIAKARGTRG